MQPREIGVYRRMSSCAKLKERFQAMTGLGSAKRVAAFDPWLPLTMCYGFKRQASIAGMAELADAADSKSADPCDRGGSTPPPGTKIIRDL